MSETIKVKATTTFTRFYETAVEPEGIEETLRMENGIYREEPVDTAFERYVSRSTGPENAVTVVELAESTPVDTPQTWVAVIVDRDGFVMAPEQIELWCTSEGGREYAHQYGDSEPDELMVVTGEAKPEPQSDAPDERFFRRPNPLLINDVLLREDFFHDRPEKIRRVWQRAVATAAAMNAAGVQ